MSGKTVWREGRLIWGALVIVGLLLGVIFWDGFNEMVKVWGTQEEYSYGYIIPFITLFLIWQKKDQLEFLPFKGSWVGFAFVALGLVLFLVGNLSTIFVVVQYAFLLVLIGLLLSFTGWQGMRPIIVPLLFLAFMIPLPVFLFNSLSSQLQLISSQIGVWVIRLFGIIDPAR
ncbi:archaeosortase/exosortase family protein [Sulfurirhabdus autotrophica]|uniref:Exosortase n=1 Tax=Sulfurirhabdus autotrophica TaxID=1706046 RepID=A0A4R3XZX8_9PROT|nr:archaeosortase/exosortase family protein [Sulfurirhabdus autotrophica]TCV83444.1 exosortase [Sulfurirhabdus autotrophica]